MSGLLRVLASLEPQSDERHLRPDAVLVPSSVTVLVLVVGALAAFMRPSFSAETQTPSDADDWAVVVPFEGAASRHFGDLHLDTGLGGAFGVGLRTPRFTARIIFGSTFHTIADRGVLVLGDSVTVASNWEISWVGVDGHYYLRHSRRGRPFLYAGISKAFLTRGVNDNVKGFRLSTGIGYERFLHRVVSLSLRAQADQLRLSNAKAAGQPVELPEALDQTALSVVFGVNLFAHP